MNSDIKVQLGQESMGIKKSFKNKVGFQHHHDESNNTSIQAEAKKRQAAKFKSVDI